MGFSLSYIAVRTDEPSAVLEDFSLKATGEFHEIPGEAAFVGAQLPTGWYLIVAEDADSSLADHAVLAEISNDYHIISCMVEEHLMISEASAWRGGIMVWSVAHDSAQGQEDVETRGNLPAEFAEVHDQLEQQRQEDPGACDYRFEAAPRLFNALTGFHYCEDNGFTFEVLEATSISPCRQGGVEE